MQKVFRKNTQAKLICFDTTDRDYHRAKVIRVDIQPKIPYLSIQILITEPKQPALCYFTGNFMKLCA
jgi:hypothetical protein